MADETNDYFEAGPPSPDWNEMPDQDNNPNCQDVDDGAKNDSIDFPIDIIREQSVRPDGCPDHYVLGWKAVRPDLTTRNGFRWYPNTIVRSDHNLDPDHDDPCPSIEGDGLCLAITMRGASSGGFPCLTLVACWYDPALVAAATKDKMRIAGEIHIGDVFETAALIRNADLRRADLNWAKLDGADLRWAKLDGANLDGAELDGADLFKANLGDANLRRADLFKANLGDANLRGADLFKANLRDANLRGARLPDSLTVEQAKQRGAFL